jgi:hypothetical protein
MNIQPPARAVHTYVQRLVAGPERVFPLLCPVREADWIEGWNPLQVPERIGCRRARLRVRHRCGARRRDLVRHAP